MIDLFAIFSKGGIVLWCFNEGANLFKNSVNELITEVILQGRGNVTSYNCQNQTIKYKLDNEFDLVFLIVYQSAIQLSYGDKFLSEVQIRFRDMYKNELSKRTDMLLTEDMFEGFGDIFDRVYEEMRRSSLIEPVKQMRTFEQSEKSQKNVASMIISKDGKKTKEPEKEVESRSPPSSPKAGVEEDEETLRNREAFLRRMRPKKSPPMSKPAANAGKKGKANRKWDLAGKAEEAPLLDYSQEPEGEEQVSSRVDVENRKLLGTRKGNLPDLPVLQPAKETGGWFSSLKNLVGDKKLTEDDIKPVLEKMKETLISKNVAAEPAERLCESVGKQLEGKSIGTFNRVTSLVKDALRESLVQLLSPKRRVDILRDVLEAKNEGRPYVITFCGVNGVGKSTNLAKVTFWLAENGHRILIAAGDTFRAGAVEQLRTHTRNINALHPNSVQLYEQGYGKDPSSLAASAIAIAAEREIDVVLVDTAGRMQDNEPLMRALSKLINVNKPDLVLFVGEALVGNEAVDQLVKFNQALFNQALADHAERNGNPRLIDGIVLTKFDTIDDKVGAAVSMAYITGQPIVFVGTGQTYNDLKNLNVDAVVNSLIK
uniref:SRP54 domain-containing protein n=1 Tax=Steinernema glaseri TaxID=37863 RepID=A0A1I8A4P7_9BILA